MRMIEIDYEARPPIDAYGGGGFRIAGEKRLGSLLHLPSGLAAWSVAAPAETTPEAFAAVLAEAGEIDVVLIGMGPDIAPLPRAAREAFEAAALGYETMSTAAACRTFNVLLAEDRRVAAALIAV
ncbi:MTH938/NDUFAF3 family protein [Albimonas sp. CAU 1670]|uniref:Mth938-like domain-containing protein n=1 Tax=Albimonas sp. CAU 1670 TaxID=3032599 RepID=UPI0023D9EDEC|nr:MTH938/NDUFAF3 family protein [Albimonas sp. CAU 1670]MDF2233085.1 MTH938/NDUFAF3 family protein [Albimonas sp. CAU 1670]